MDGNAHRHSNQHPYQQHHQPHLHHHHHRRVSILKIFFPFFLNILFFQKSLFFFVSLTVTWQDHLLPALKLLLERQDLKLGTRLRV